MWCMWEYMCFFFLLSLFVVIIIVVIIAGLSANPCFLHYFLCRCGKCPRRKEKKTITLLFGCIQKKRCLRENDTYVLSFAQNGHEFDQKKKWNGHNDNNIVFSSHFLMLSSLRGYRSYSLWYDAWNTRSKATVTVSLSLMWLSPATEKRRTNVYTASRYAELWIVFQLCRYIIRIHMWV